MIIGLDTVVRPVEDRHIALEKPPKADQDQSAD